MAADHPSSKERGELDAVIEEMDAHASTKRPGSMIGMWVRRLRTGLEDAEARASALHDDVHEWIAANGPGGWIDNLRKGSGWHGVEKLAEQRNAAYRALEKILDMAVTKGEDAGHSGIEAIAREALKGRQDETTEPRDPLCYCWHSPAPCPKHHPELWRKLGEQVNGDCEK